MRRRDRLQYGTGKVVSLNNLVRREDGNHLLTPLNKSNCLALLACDSFCIWSAFEARRRVHRE